MRWALAGGAIFGVLAFLSGSAAGQPLATPTRAQLQLMPLPQSVFGSEAGPLRVDSSSGWTSNKESANDDFDATMTARKLARIGRIIGFDVEFDDLTKASRPGLLVDADSDVDLFRSESGAARYFALQLSEFHRFEGKKLQNGLSFDHVSYFAVPRIAGAEGIRFRIHAGALTLWETGVEFRIGVLVASAGLGRTDTKDVQTEPRLLATALNRRIHGVLAGTVHDKPLTQRIAKLGGLGRPPGGPDLSKMTPLAIDFTGRAKPTRESYVRDSDDVAKFIRTFNSVRFGSSTLALLEATVELRPTTKSATDYVALQRSLVGGANGLTYLRNAIASGIPKSQRNDIRLSGLKLTDISAGDAAFAYRATMQVLSTHARVQLAVCLLRRGPVVETLSLVGAAFTTLAQVDVVRAARTASARIDLALRG